ncbi:MAG: transketolase [Candidatus Omnitrophica bacterium]|nr:transketolase [Candidatus Omnitrophota bacterium]MBD3269677.1 transketolase [Candidatus Omnitrophota bacterium]
MKKVAISYLEKKSRYIRRQIIDITMKAGSGHIAPSFSCVEILTFLYYAATLRFNPKKPNWSKRDRFILSKGHAAIALYVVLADLGFFPCSYLKNFIQQGGCLCAHPENHIAGVEAYSGSLGHGLSIAAGLALASKMDNKDYISTVLLGDGECHEGAVWEAAMFSSQHKLNNLIAIIDYNGASAIDFLPKYLTIEPLEEKWKAFGWEVITIDGHSFRELKRALSGIRNRSSDKPLLVIALTVKGKGVSFMENNPIWHYRIPTEKEFNIINKELRYGKF